MNFIGSKRVWLYVIVILVISISRDGFCLDNSNTNAKPTRNSARALDHFKNDPSKIDCGEDTTCKLDKLGFEAIQVLHMQIDDDHNGNLDRSESDEFLREELHYEDGFDRGSDFHGLDDQISVEDLWRNWVNSEVYNWTVEDVTDWVLEEVELPQYVDQFRINAVDGHSLPRIAANNQYVSTILGVKNLVHRQKLVLKAMDSVLFGAPKRHSYIKDVTLVSLLLVALGGCWLAYVQHRHSQGHLSKVMADLEKLQRAESSLCKLRTSLEEEHREFQEEKSCMEQRMKDEIKAAKSEADRLRSTRETTNEEIHRLRLAEEELIQVRLALRQAEKELETRPMAALEQLQQWLQITYEIENQHYELKREAADRQLVHAKEMCEKIRRKKGAFFGSLRIAHTTSLDDTDQLIMAARSALQEVSQDLQERSHRWGEIERLCGFGISVNPGIRYLEGQLHSTGLAPKGYKLVYTRSGSSSSAMPMDLDTADEDIPPGGVTAAMMNSMLSDIPEHRVTPLTGAFGSSSSLNTMSSSYSHYSNGGLRNSLTLSNLQSSQHHPTIPRPASSLTSTPTESGKLLQHRRRHARSSDTESNPESDEERRGLMNEPVIFHLGDSLQKEFTSGGSPLAKSKSSKNRACNSSSHSDSSPSIRSQSINPEEDMNSASLARIPASSSSVIPQTSPVLVKRYVTQPRQTELSKADAISNKDSLLDDKRAMEESSRCGEEQPKQKGKFLRKILGSSKHI